MSTHTDKNDKTAKRKYWRVKFDLIKTRSKLFCILYAPVIITLFEIFLEEYREYKSKNKGGGDDRRV